MDEIDTTNLTEQTKVRLNKKVEIQNYFPKEINQRKSWSKKVSKYVAAFDYMDKTLIVSSFSLTTGLIKKLLSITTNKKKKHDKILMLAKSKLNSIKALVSQALIGMGISHEEFIVIFKEKDKYEKMKENVRNVSEKQENMRLNSVDSRKTASL